MPKKPRKEQSKDEKEWPVVVYIWAVGIGVVGYLVAGEMVLASKPHPIHWLAGLVGGVVGIGMGWLWYRWRGDVF